MGDGFVWVWVSASVWVRGGFVSGLVAKIKNKCFGTRCSRPAGGSHEEAGRPPCVFLQIPVSDGFNFVYFVQFV